MTMASDVTIACLWQKEFREDFASFKKKVTRCVQRSLEGE
jgi:hypothetical protein